MHAGQAGENAITATAGRPGRGRKTIIRNCQRILSALLFVCLFHPVSAPAQTPGDGAAPGDPAQSVEQEMQRRLVEQTAGSHTLRTHDLPVEFVRRVADRIIRMQVQQQLRSVARPQTEQDDSNQALADFAGGESGQAAPSHLGVVLICAVMVAILALTRRKAPQPAPTPRKRRRK